MRLCPALYVNPAMFVSWVSRCLCIAVKLTRHITACLCKEALFSDKKCCVNFWEYLFYLSTSAGDSSALSCFCVSWVVLGLCVEWDVEPCLLILLLFWCLYFLDVPFHRHHHLINLLWHCLAWAQQCFAWNLIIKQWDGNVAKFNQISMFSTASRNFLVSVCLLSLFVQYIALW